MLSAAEQCGGAVALVVVRHCPATPLLDRQSWLGTIECLDLAFLVDAQDQGLVWRVEIKADHIVELFDKTLVAAELESLVQMRLKPVSIPNTLNGHPADALRLGHCHRQSIPRSTIAAFVLNSEQASAVVNKNTQTLATLVII